MSDWREVLETLKRLYIDNMEDTIEKVYGFLYKDCDCPICKANHK